MATVWNQVLGKMCIGPKGITSHLLHLHPRNIQRFNLFCSVPPPYSTNSTFSVVAAAACHFLEQRAEIRGLPTPTIPSCCSRTMVDSGGAVVAVALFLVCILACNELPRERWRYTHVTLPDTMVVVVVQWIWWMIFFSHSSFFTHPKLIFRD